MIRLKIAIIAALAMLSAMTVKAEDSYVRFYVEPDDIETPDGVATVNVWLDTNVATLNAFNLNIYLSKGFTIETNRRGAIVITKNPDEDVIYDHTFAAADHTDADDPYYTVVAYSPTNSYLLEGNNLLFSFKVNAPADFTAANLPSLDERTGRLSGIVIAEDTDTDPIGHYPADYTFYFRPQGVPTGVEAVGVDTADEEVIYNLQGIRVHRPLAPGLYIINGRKTAVK